MDTELALALGRVFERLLVCLFAGAAIIAGYHLFRVGIVDPQAADLRSQSFSLKLQKCGPGIFFALFGTVILSMCLSESLKIGLIAPKKNESPALVNQRAPSTQIEYLGGNASVDRLDICKSI